MRIIIEDAPDELVREFASLIARSQGGLEEGAAGRSADGWTESRAEHLLYDLPPYAVELLRAVVAGDGWAPVASLAGECGGVSLRARTVAMTRAVSRGAAAGKWPRDIPAPVYPRQDPDRTTGRRVVGYVMPGETLAGFRAALRRFGR
ncbi:hypothetical protein ACIQU5_03510 [Streptomyces sp. NPDC090306]|uniref:hypothetical protein n=1 Tax=Streptomyces sp. NPDC090306 TaxID=3365961 RepID=UPI0037FE1BC8